MAVFVGSVGVSTDRITVVAGRPGDVSGYQVILEPGIGQFREFEFRRVHTRINS